jgi:glycosyltransferase involved in cell wall biosynthesis
MLRALMLSPYYPAHGGGVEAVAARLATGLALRGIDIDWMATDADQGPASAPGLEIRPLRAWNGVERRTGVPCPLASPAALWAVRSAVRSHDLVIVHDALYLTHLWAIMTARRAGVPLLLIQHLGDVPYENPLLRAVVHVANASATRWALDCAARVVFISSTVQTWFVARHPRIAGKCELVSNGVDTRVFSRATSDIDVGARRSLGCAAGPLLLFVGRFVARKGIALLVQLAQRMPEATFVFIGAGPLDPCARASSNVRVLERTGAAELAAWYRSADLLLLPSVGEGFPLVVQEALACGLPVVVGADTAAASPPWPRAVLGLPVTGSASDVSAWQRAVTMRLASLPDERERRDIAARATALWSWERTLDRYAEIARELAEA